MIDSGQVTIETTLTLIYENTTGSACQIHIHHPHGGSASVYLGDASVLSTTGYEFSPEDHEITRLDVGDKLYGIAAAGSHPISFFIDS